MTCQGSNLIRSNTRCSLSVCLASVICGVRRNRHKYRQSYDILSAMHMAFMRYLKCSIIMKWREYATKMLVDGTRSTLHQYRQHDTSAGDRSAECSKTAELTGRLPRLLAHALNGRHTASSTHYRMEHSLQRPIYCTAITTCMGNLMRAEAMSAMISHHKAK